MPHGVLSRRARFNHLTLPSILLLRSRLSFQHSLIRRSIEEGKERCRRVVTFWTGRHTPVNSGSTEATHMMKGDLNS